jgi:ABC-type oligopeptide transport system substrate-binding subunit
MHAQLQVTRGAGIEQAACKIVNPRERTRALQEAERILLDEAPVLPLFTYVNKGMLNHRVKG